MEIIAEKNDFTKIFYSGCKSAQSIGLEYEKLPVYKKDYTAVRYENIVKLLLELENDDRTVIFEDKNPMGMILPQGHISLEPGSQFEISLNPVKNISDIRKMLDESNSIELRDYFRRLSEYIPDDRKVIMSKINQGLDHCFRYTHRTFYVPTEKNYQALIDMYHIDQMEGFIPYKELKQKWDDENTTVFNIPEGQKIVKNVFEFAKDTENIHPTQEVSDVFYEWFGNMSKKLKKAA